jgi:hypothetical protein
MVLIDEWVCPYVILSNYVFSCHSWHYFGTCYPYNDNQAQNINFPSLFSFRLCRLLNYSVLILSLTLWAYPHLICCCGRYWISYFHSTSAIDHAHPEQWVEPIGHEHAPLCRCLSHLPETPLLTLTSTSDSPELIPQT